jgi:hypothetical protein
MEVTDKLRTHKIGDWVGSRTGLDAVAKRKTSVLAGNQILVVQPVIGSL